MNETEFQAIFKAYEEAITNQLPDPVPTKLHIMVYNYAQLRHQQTSDVAADFYLYILSKMTLILSRYEPKKSPFYQYMATQLNFEFRHFLRRRKMARKPGTHLSTEELNSGRIELQYNPSENLNILDAILARTAIRPRLYAKLAITHPLTVTELKYIIRSRKGKKPQSAMQVLRSYRAYLRFTEERKLTFSKERERMLDTLLRLEQDEAAIDSPKSATKRDKMAKKFFSIDTRIPLRMVAEITGDPIATVQRQMKTSAAALKQAYRQWEKQNLSEKNKLTSGVL